MAVVRKGGPMRAFDPQSERLRALPQPGVPAHHLRHRLSRRSFMGGAAGVTATALGASLLRPIAARAAPPFGSAPKPTTNVVSLNGVDFHLTFFAPGADPSTITDFNGLVGVAEVQGQGTATNPDNSTETLLFDTDMRFMDGVYVGQDGATHRGTFAFV